MGGMGMEYGGAPDVRQERTRVERLTEGLTVAVASALALGLLAGPAIVFGSTAWHLVTDPGATTFSRFTVPLVFVVLMASPFVLARMVFRAGRRKGGESLTAAVPGALTLLGVSVVLFAVLCLIVVNAD